MPIRKAMVKAHQEKEPRGDGWSYGPSWPWANDRVFAACIHKEMRDRDGDLLLADAIAKSMPTFMRRGNLHDSHTNESRGRPLGWKRMGDEVHVKFGVWADTKNDDTFWDSVKGCGEACGVSVGVDVEGKRAGRVFTELGTFEVSWLRPGINPSNPAAHVTDVNTIAKSCCAECESKTKDMVSAPTGSLFPESVPTPAQAYESLRKPFAGYEDFAACVLANQDKNDPEAYCAEIMRQVEGKEGMEMNGKKEYAMLLKAATEMAKLKHEIATKQPQGAHYGGWGETFEECVRSASSWSDNPEGFCNYVHQQFGPGGAPGTEDRAAGKAWNPTDHSPKATQDGRTVPVTPEVHNDGARSADTSGAPEISDSNTGHPIQKQGMGSSVSGSVKTSEPAKIEMKDADSAMRRELDEMRKELADMKAQIVAVNPTAETTPKPRGVGGYKEAAHECPGHDMPHEDEKEAAYAKAVKEIETKMEAKCSAITKELDALRTAAKAPDVVASKSRGGPSEPNGETLVKTRPKTIREAMEKGLSPAAIFGVVGKKGVA